MDKRYQIFISSTYIDLQQERIAAMEGVLGLRHLPCGMEYFPASSDTQWNYIKELIDQCDYYIVIIGGTYGSVDGTGVSYTEKEYDYAISKHIPTLAFVHSSPKTLPADKYESENIDNLNKLKSFIKKVKTKLCYEWNDTGDLKAAIITSLVDLTNRQPRTGWVRADQIASFEATKEILRLRDNIDLLQNELDFFQRTNEDDIQNLAQGKDEFIIPCKYTFAKSEIGLAQRGDYSKGEYNIKTDWETIFGYLSPDIYPHNSTAKLKSALERGLKFNLQYNLESKEIGYIHSLFVPKTIFDQIINQFNALGYIEIDNFEGKTTSKKVALTDLGKKLLLKITAIKRPNEE